MQVSVEKPAFSRKRPGFFAVFSLVLSCLLLYNISLLITAVKKGAVYMVKIEQSNGTISITNEVFTNLAGDAATSCFGVKGMVGRSKDSGPFQLLRRESMSKGVNATFADDGSISLELHIAVDHGVNISALAHSIINEVSYKVNQATGVPVARVDVFVDSMFLD